MNRKPVLATAFVWMLWFSAMIGAQFVNLASANSMPLIPDLPHIYIRSDGSIEPSTAPIKRVGNIYILTQNLFTQYVIEVQRDNVVIDGMGHTIQGLARSGIILSGRRNVTIKNIHLKKFNSGVQLIKSHNNIIAANTLAGNDIGIVLNYAVNNTIVGNKISANGNGILIFSDCNYNRIIRNNLTNNVHGGIWFERPENCNSNFNSIVHNNISLNKQEGIMCRSTFYNTIVGNTIANNGYGSVDGSIIHGYGIFLSSSNNNLFYHNNFVNNYKQIANLGCTNAWDNSAEGNYWSDYNGTDSNKDGIGDTPYIIETRHIEYIADMPRMVGSDTQDKYPLMKLINIRAIKLPPFPIPDTHIVPTENLTPSPPLIAMPEEYINYTITHVNGSLWAKVDGIYPLYVSYGKFGSDDLSKLDDTSLLVTSDELPMFYPTPPGTTNISVKMNETKLNWSNYTKTHPEATHHTAIGDWPMIYCTIHPVPDHFILKIHYEHPIILINGSYVFLYDLNISPYLSPWCNKSTAYFNIRMETKYEDFQVYTTGSEEWNPVNYTLIKENKAGILSIKIISEYNKPLLGDLAVTFTDAKASSPIEYSYAIIALIGTAIASVAGYQFLKRINMRFNDKHLRPRCAAVKTFAAFSVLLFLIVAGTLLISFGTANPVPPTSTISVTSPQKNKAYTVDNISLTFSVTTHIYVSPCDLISKPLIKYYLDGNLQGQFESKFTRDSPTKNFSVTLTDLSDGLHWVEVTKTAHWNVIMIGNYAETSSSGMIGFTVDTTHPSISILAPQDHQAYDANDILLNFIISEPVRWISYRLDQQASVRITGNTILTGLSDGAHSLIVYARDIAGNQGVSEIFFSINTQQSQPSLTPQPTNPPAQQSSFLGSNSPMQYGCAIVIVTAAAIAAVAGYLFVKRKKSATATEPASPN